VHGLLAAPSRDLDAVERDHDARAVAPVVAVDERRPPRRSR
jgi:hypothetical protein